MYIELKITSLYITYQKWTLYLSSWEIYRLTISVELENGGYYVFENRDDRLGYKIAKKWPTHSVNLKGIKTVESYAFHWDTELPYYHCIKWFCASLPLYVPDTSKSVSIILSLKSNS